MWPTRRWSARPLTTRAGWATTPPHGACTGPGRTSPSGAVAGRPGWVPERPDGSVSTWIRALVSWPSTASPTATPTSFTCTRPSSTDRFTQGSGSVRGPGPRCSCANWNETEKMGPSYRGSKPSLAKTGFV